MRRRSASAARELPLPGLDTLVRDGDPETSLAAATKALRASKKAVKTIRTAMADGVERIDEEIWMECRKLGLVSSFAVVRHGRLALQRAGMVENTGATRKTSEGSQSIVWRTKEPITRTAIAFRESATINPRRAVIAAEKKRNAYAQAIVAAYHEIESRLLQADFEMHSILDNNVLVRVAKSRVDALTEALEIVGKLLAEKDGANG